MQSVPLQQGHSARFQIEAASIDLDRKESQVRRLFTVKMPIQPPLLTLRR